MISPQWVRSNQTTRESIWVNWTKGDQQVQLRILDLSVVVRWYIRHDYMNLLHRLDGPALYTFRASKKEAERLTMAQSPEDYDIDWGSPRTCEWYLFDYSIETIFSDQRLPYLFPKIEMTDIVNLYHRYKDFNCISMIADTLGIDIGKLRNLVVLDDLA